MEEQHTTVLPSADYNDEDIKTLDWMEHIRRRPGMYIGKLGDGSYADDGIYVLLKEVLDNSIDEYMMGFGKTIEVTIEEGTVAVRDYGRGVPLGKVVDVSSKMNTGAKSDSKAFKKSVGLHGVGMKAVNALSSSFLMKSPMNFATVGPSGPISFEPNFVLVWLSKTGSSTLILMAATIPERMSEYSKFLL